MKLFNLIVVWSLWRPKSYSHWHWHIQSSVPLTCIHTRSAVCGRPCALVSIDSDRLGLSLPLPPLPPSSRAQRPWPNSISSHSFICLSLIISYLSPSEIQYHSNYLISDRWRKGKREFMPYSLCLPPPLRDHIAALSALSFYGPCGDKMKPIIVSCMKTKRHWAGDPAGCCKDEIIRDKGGQLAK